MKTENIDTAAAAASALVTQLPEAHRAAIEANNQFAILVTLALINDAAALAVRVTHAATAAQLTR